MRRSLTFTLSIVLAAAGLPSCGGDQSDTALTNNPLSQLTAAANQLSKGLTDAANRKPVPPVSYKQLIDYLPKGMGDMKGDPPKGETTSAGQWQYSQAEADYRNPDGSRSANVGIFDYAHIPFLYVPFQMMLNMKVSTESTDGYERSAQIGGFPAYEKWSKSGESEAIVMVGDRFIVKTSTRGVGEGSARKIAEDLDLKGLGKAGN
jgi:hypothetical protein